jgi:replicative DNA helicase
MITKIPPHSLDAERWVLGSILIDKEWMIQVWNLITAADFYEPNHSLIYQAMVDLFSKNKPIDLLTVKEVLDNRKELEKIWWNLFLIELANSVFTSANIFEYAQIIKNKSVLRKLIHSGNQIIMNWYNEEDELNKILEKSEQSLLV